MSRLIAVLAFLVFVGFVGILAIEVPSPDLVAIVVLTVVLVAYDLWSSVLRRRR